MCLTRNTPNSDKKLALTVTYDDEEQHAQKNILTSCECFKKRKITKKSVVCLPSQLKNIQIKCSLRSVNFDMC